MQLLPLFKKAASCLTVGEVGEVGGIMLVKLLGRQGRHESLEATASRNLVVASLLK
jgi:hypothetical protein